MSFKEILEKNNLTAYSLAKISGVGTTTITDLVSGKSSIEKCNIKTINSIAKALNVSIEELLNDVLESDKVINIYLMNKNTKVLKVSFNKEYSLMQEVLEVINIKYAPLHIYNAYNNKSINFLKAINEWFTGRGIPSWRKDLESLLEKLNVKSSNELLDKAYGLSLSDQYWIKEESSSLKWSDINFFDNDFKYEGYLNASIDSSSSKSLKQADLRSPNNTTDGMLQKGWIIEKGKRVLVKGTYTPNREEPFNEWLASNISKRLGFDYCDYKLDFINEKFVSKCDDFISSNEEIITANDIFDSEKKPNNINDYEFYISVLEKHKVKNARRNIANMFLVDYLIMNIDRHMKNFGVIRNVETLKWIKTTPIFDSGESMQCDKYTYNMNFNSGKGRFFTNTDKDYELILKTIKNDLDIDINKLDGICDEYRSILKEFQNRLEISETRIEALVNGLEKRISKLKRNLSK